VRPLALLLFACASPPPPADPPPLAALVGDCDGGTPLTAEGVEEGPAHEVGDLAAYDVLVRIADVPEGYVRARADAHWTSDRRNVLGYLPAGTSLWAQGPLKDTEGSGGLGYAVPVRDLAGATCRAYISYTVVASPTLGPTP